MDQTSPLSSLGWSLPETNSNAALSQQAEEQNKMENKVNDTGPWPFSPLQATLPDG